MLLYFYDLKIKSLKAYNTLKRRFYYELANSKLASAPFRTKSVLIISDDLEFFADNFFKKYTGFIEVYKARTTSIVQIN